MEFFATLITYGFAAAGLYTLYGAYRRLYLSPVAKFPGRKLAAVTFWYEFYYDVVKGGAYVYEIEKMHVEYGEFALKASLSTLLRPFTLT